MEPLVHSGRPIPQLAWFSWIEAIAQWVRKHLFGWQKAVPALVPPPVSPPPSNPLRTSHFVGGYTPMPSPVVNGGQATYDGTLLVTVLDRALVAAALPPGLELAQRTDSVQTHPVILMLGMQRDLCWLANGMLIPGGTPAYNELILLIPYVVRTGGAKWHNCVIRMYLDNFSAVFIGNLIYAYAKEMATFAKPGTKTEVMKAGVEVFNCDITLSAPAVPATTAAALPEGFSEVQEVFRMPIVGCFGAGLNLPPNTPTPLSYPYSCSYFEWDYANAQVAPASSVFTFVRPFNDGMQGWVDLGQLANTPNGAFRISGLRWRLSSELPPWQAGEPPACDFY